LLFLLSRLTTLRFWNPFFEHLERRTNVGNSLTVQILTESRLAGGVLSPPN
jgi:hypothetical protein